MRQDAPFRLLETPEPGATVFTCSLCGFRFTHGEKVCGCCPFAAGCDIVRCPHCGYAFPRSSLVVTWIRRLLRRSSESPVPSGPESAEHPSKEAHDEP